MFRLPKRGKKAQIESRNDPSLVLGSNAPCGVWPRGTKPTVKSGGIYLRVTPFDLIPPHQTNHHGSSLPEPSKPPPSQLGVPPSPATSPLVTGAALRGNWSYLGVSHSPGWLPWGHRRGSNASRLPPLPALPSHITFGTRRRSRSEHPFGSQAPGEHPVSWILHWDVV